MHGRPLSGRSLSGRSLAGSGIGQPRRGGGGGSAFSPVSLGPLAFWLPNASVSTGTVADLSGNGHHLTQGTAGRRPTYNTGPVRLTFDGSDDCLEIPFAVCDALSGGSACSLVAGVDTAAMNSVIRLQPGASEYVILGFDSGTGPQFIVQPDGGTTGVALTGSEDDALHQIIGTWTRNATNGMKGYVDGAITAQRDSADVPLPTFQNNFPAAVGAYLATGTPAELFTGSMTHMIVFARALSASEVAQLYAWHLAQS